MTALVDAHQAAASGACPPVLLFGMARDKPLAEVLDALAPLRGRSLCCGVASPRAQAPEVLAEAFAARGWESCSAASVEQGLAQARQEARARGAHVLVTGSLHLAGEVLELLGEATDRAWV
jgi:folylpolyglutamate synthase/dihydropteroate synthase